MSSVNKFILIYPQILKGMFIPSSKFPDKFLNSM